VVEVPEVYIYDIKCEKNMDRGSSLKGTFSQHTDLLRKYLGPQLPGTVLLAVLLAGGIALQLAYPQVIRFYLDTAQGGGPQHALLVAALLFISLSVAQKGVSLGAGMQADNLGWRSANALRKDLALHCLRLDMNFHKAHTPGELIERIDGDASELSNFLSSFVVKVIGNALLAAGILALLFLEDGRVGAGITLFTLLTLTLLAALQRVAVRHWSAGREASAAQYGFMEESISGAEDIRANGAVDYALNRLHHFMQRLIQTHRRAWMFATLTYNTTTTLFAAGYAIGLAVGVSLYLSGQATIGTAYLIVFYIGMLTTPVQEIRREVQDLQRASASLSRINELLELKPKVIDPDMEERVAATWFQEEAGSQASQVEFCRVTFGYEKEHPVLKGLDLVISPGRVLGVLGRTGSGKTTLTRLLFRLYDPDEGQIRLDGIDLRRMPLELLRGRTGMVTQDVQLFQASVRDNLTLFNLKISDERLQDALLTLGLWEWVISMPAGLDTVVGSGGQGLSAGEAQLLAFTRVFLKNPGLVILDEASSRLDPATENMLERSLDRLFSRRTGIIIAHRLETVNRADDILILEEGRVVEYGERTALAANPGSRFSSLLHTGMEEALQ
jgi:ATP-binding cassette, subfamily B, bacterial